MYLPRLIISLALAASVVLGVKNNTDELCDECDSKGGSRYSDAASPFCRCQCNEGYGGRLCEIQALEFGTKFTPLIVTFDNSTGQQTEFFSSSSRLYSVYRGMLNVDPTNPELIIPQFRMSNLEPANKSLVVYNIAFSNNQDIALKFMEAVNSPEPPAWVREATIVSAAWWILVRAPPGEYATDDPDAHGAFGISFDFFTFTYIVPAAIVSILFPILEAILGCACRSSSVADKAEQGDDEDKHKGTSDISHDSDHEVEPSEPAEPVNKFPLPPMTTPPPQVPYGQQPPASRKFVYAP